MIKKFLVLLSLSLYTSCSYYWIAIPDNTKPYLDDGRKKIESNKNKNDIFYNEVMVVKSMIDCDFIMRVKFTAIKNSTIVNNEDIKYFKMKAFHLNSNAIMIDERSKLNDYSFAKILNCKY